jgi:hypothetical protein
MASRNPQETMKSLIAQQSLLLKSLENTEMIRQESQSGFKSIQKSLNDIEQLLRGTFQDGFGLKPKYYTLADVSLESNDANEETKTETSEAATTTVTETLTTLEDEPKEAETEEKND